MTPFTPQQNGVVERRNRTVMAMARSLLKGTHMPARFWGEAVRHAVYMLNHLPTKALGECTPFEAWMGRKPHLAHLRIFGCVAYVKNIAPHLKKLDDRISPMVYLGANKDENLPLFMVVDAFNIDEVIVAADVEAGAEHVTPPAIAIVPMPRASSPSTPPSNAHAVTSPPIHGKAYNHASQGGQIDSQKQKTVTLSSCEAEFMATTTAACHALWLRSLASELINVEPKPVTLFVDNKSVIALMKNPVFHGRSKHIDTRFHFIRECIEKRQIAVEFVNTGEYRADVLT
ncbi:hypothetical protein ZIOFF_039784 [Zingiber officinale]|uniref:Integrase catalytic domain-containing protein n=1 Tax=Zingiber officinale TaxID=94328 RepID=A0A8J5G1T6_ZINOF|nr:hypothetical protein ZIOFF_039784 [Zingiber officinale]